MLDIIIAIYNAVEHVIGVLFILIFLSTVIGIFAGGNTWTRFVALAFDFFWNVITGGQIGVTISSRSYIASQEGKGWGKTLSYGLGRLEKDHCELAVQGDIDRAKAVIATLAPYDTRPKI